MRLSVFNYSTKKILDHGKNIEKLNGPGGLRLPGKEEIKREEPKVDEHQSTQIRTGMMNFGFGKGVLGADGVIYNSKAEEETPKTFKRAILK